MRRQSCGKQKKTLDVSAAKTDTDTMKTCAGRKLFIIERFVSAAAVCCVFCALPLAAQTSIAYSGGEKYVMVERSDLRRYDNGTYSGLLCREVRSFVNPAAVPAGANARLAADAWFSGNFFVLEQTKSYAKPAAAQEISGMFPALFAISSEGKMTMQTDSGYPQYRSFPVYPSEKVSLGMSWQAESERAVDPAGNGKITRLKPLVQYTFAGEENYKGIEVYRISAKWATRYNLLQYRDYNGDPELESASGTHDAQILVRKDTGAAMLIRDNLDETFVYSGGKKIQLKGSTLLFTEFPPAVDRKKLIPALNRIAQNAGTVESDAAAEKLPQPKPSAVASAAERLPPKPPAVASAVKTVPPKNPPDSRADPSPSGRKKSAAAVASAFGGGAGKTSDAADSAKTKTDSRRRVVVEETPAGVRLSVRDLRFRADSAELLAGESARLDEIAAVLRQIPDGQFLIEGHTAAVGKPEGEKKLSAERAKKIADEFIRRGFDADRFLYAGLGSGHPVAENTTEAGRALNRRVEITILE
ncbi:MAG: OmpA family protein [Bacteroides sp.]|nr:OmpA family protein [Prevotella sp.]MCM1408697.1 OmpA family protein [Treponema brennaborense]MCM1470558.1 OmpA family protein [Bacteroides sp.]